MTLPLLSECRSLGVTLRMAGDHIDVSGPRPAVEALLPKIREHKPDLIRELSRPADDRWNPELVVEDYVWCLDCRHFAGFDPDGDMGRCGHTNNPFRCQQPRAPRKCRWHVAKRERA